MTTAETAGRLTGVAPGILDKERTIAAAGFNRWLVPMRVMLIMRPACVPPLRPPRKRKGCRWRCQRSRDWARRRELLSGRQLRGGRSDALLPKKSSG